MSTCFVFDVNDARFLIALLALFSAQAKLVPLQGTTFAKNDLVNPSIPAKMVIGVPSSPMNM